MVKKANIPKSNQKTSKKFSLVSYTEAPSDIHAQKERELKKLKADQSELAGITQQLNQYRSDPLILLTQRETVSALEQRATDITNRYGSQSALDKRVAELTEKVSDPKLRYLNSPDYRSQYQRLLDLGAGGQPVQNNFKEMGLEYLTPEERGAYNYHYYKHGKDKADEYLSGIQWDVNQRRANEILEGANVEDNWAADFVSKLPLAYKAGLDSAQKGGQQFLGALAGDDTYSVPSAIQMASAQARERMADKGLTSQMAYDVAAGMGQMTPALLTSTLADLVLPGSGKVLGAGLQGISSAGGAYQDAINRGHTPDQARGYGILTGASEAGLGYLLSGIGKLGGKVTGPMVEKLSGKVNNALLKVAANYGGNMLSEFGEEYLQSVLSKVFENLTLGTNNDIDLLSEDVIYDGLVGSLNSLVLGVSGNAFSGVNGIPDAQTLAQENLMFKTQTGPQENVDFDRKGRAFDPVRESSFKVMDSISRNTGKRFHIYESYVNQEGNRVYRDGEGQEVAAPNGFYKDGEFHIDLNAGETGEGSMLYTVAHELTHFIKEQSPDQFNALAEAAMEVHGQSRDALIQRQIEKAARQGLELTSEEALEEVVADSMESMLQSGNVPRMLGKLRRQNMPLFQKVTSFLADTASNLRSAVDAYSTLTPNTPEGRAVAQASDKVAQLENNYTSALVEASDRFESSKKFATDKDGEYVTIHYSKRAQDLTDYDVLTLIENSNYGEYALDTYVPIRKNTPSLLVELSQREGLKPIKDLPIIMNVEHIQQCMDETAVVNDNKRGHELTSEDILEITKALDNPRYVFFQQDNQRYSCIVEFGEGRRKEKGMAVVDFGGNKNANLMNGFEGGAYNVLVTAFPPDSKYWKKYQQSENNLLVYDKVEGTPQGSSQQRVPSLLNEVPSTEGVPQRRYGSHVPSLLNGMPSATSITEASDEFKQKNSLREQAAQQYTRWLQEAEAAKGMYGDFDMQAELQNPRFRHLLRSGISVPDAYLAAHQEEILINAVRAGLRRGEENVNRRVEENRRRPRENGLDPGAAFITRPNPAKMTKADRQAIARRAQKGEKITF